MAERWLGCANGRRGGAWVYRCWGWRSGLWEGGLVALAVGLVGRLGVGRCAEVLGAEDRRVAERCGEDLGVVGQLFGEEGLRLRRVVVVGRREFGTGFEVRRG